MEFFHHFDCHDLMCHDRILNLLMDNKEVFAKNEVSQLILEIFISRKMRFVNLYFFSKYTVENFSIKINYTFHFYLYS